MAKKSASKVIKSLNADGMKDWIGVLQGQANGGDHARAILGAVYLDELLRELIMDFLIEEQDIVNEMFNVDRPLSTFSARIKIAFVLGLICREVFDDLNIIRDIRNTFAHSLQGVSFENEDIKDWCYRLHVPHIRVPNMEVGTLPEQIFVSTTYFIAEYLKGIKEVVRADKRQIPDDIWD